LKNCTFYKNSTTDIIRCAGQAEITNCVLWDDSITEIYQNPELIVSNCCIKGGFAGQNILSEWPMLALEDNLRLMRGSPCIDAGIEMGVATDAAGRTRSIDGNGDGQILPDIGAYEFSNDNEPAVSLPEGAEFESYENGYEPKAIKVLVRNLGREKVKYKITSENEWLRAEPNVVEIDKSIASFRMRANPAGLGIGVHRGKLVIGDVNGTGKTEVEATIEIFKAYHVPSEYASISEAMTAATNNAFIVLEPGEYESSGNALLSTRNQNFRICSTNPLDMNDQARAVSTFRRAASVTSPTPVHVFRAPTADTKCEKCMD
jgi:hypothetical protein